MRTRNETRFRGSGLMRITPSALDPSAINAAIASNCVLGATRLLDETRRRQKRSSCERNVRFSARRRDARAAETNSIQHGPAKEGNSEPWLLRLSLYKFISSDKKAARHRASEHLSLAAAVVSTLLPCVYYALNALLNAFIASSSRARSLRFCTTGLRRARFRIN